MTSELNIGNTLFEGFNDKEGIMICGYEWGLPKEEIEKNKNSQTKIDFEAETTFSNKINVHKKNYPYDERIIKWFKLWGHPLQRNNNGKIEKCIVQTNWCNTQGNNMKKISIHQKLLNCKDNFLFHIEKLHPKIIFFMGSKMIDVLNNQEIKKDFMRIMGREIKPLQKLQKPFNGRVFKIGFQSFEKCDVISLPHPSGSRGLSDEYIKLFKDEIKTILDKYREYKKV